MKDELIASVSGLRGIAGGSLTTMVAVRYVAALESLLPPGPIVIGRDGRESGPEYCSAIKEFLTSRGRDVLDAGIASTPTLGILVQSRAAAGGIQISASHNSAKYNGLKCFRWDGRILPAEDGLRVVEAFRLGTPMVQSDRKGNVTCVDGTAEHLRRVLAIVDGEAIRQRHIGVFLDSGHGAGSRLGQELLNALGCRVSMAGDEPDGRYEHEPEPTAENLVCMLPQIERSASEVGFFQDPDADRLAIASAEGRYLGEESTFALAVEHRLSKSSGTIVTNCSTSRMSALIAERYGATCHMSAVGEANVVDMMLSTGAVLGGEGNGGVIDPRVGLVRDSFVAMAVVLDQMVARNQSVESLSQLLPHLEMRKLKIELDPSKLSAVLEALRMRYPNATESRLDGLRLEWSHQWLLVRGSNTEPVVRMIAEGADSNGVDELITEATAVVQVCANSGESVQKDRQTGP